MIKVFNLYKSYGGIAPVLLDISFDIQDGEFVFLTGQSGAGTVSYTHLTMPTICSV